VARVRLHLSASASACRSVMCDSHVFHASTLSGRIMLDWEYPSSSRTCSVCTTFLPWQNAIFVRPVATILPFSVETLS
jgi:hypothetical protein